MAMTTLVGMSPFEEMSVYERLEWLRLRVFDADGLVMGSREFSVFVGQSEGWLSALKTRTKTEPWRTITAEVALGVASACDSNAEWILTGRGQPFRPRYPERDEALAEFPDLPAEVRNEILGMKFHLGGGARPSKRRWIGYIETTLAAFARGEKFGEHVPESADAKPTAGRK